MKLSTILCRLPVAMLDVKTRTACVSPIVSTKSQNALNGLSASAVNAQHTGKRKRNEFSSTEDIGSPFIIYVWHLPCSGRSMSNSGLQQFSPIQRSKSKSP